MIEYIDEFRAWQESFREPSKRIIYLKFIRPGKHKLRGGDFQVFFSVVNYYFQLHYPFGRIGKMPVKYSVETTKINHCVTYNLFDSEKYDSYTDKRRDIYKALRYIKNWVKHTYEGEDILIYTDVVKYNQNIESLCKKAKSLKDTK